MSKISDVPTPLGPWSVIDRAMNLTVNAANDHSNAATEMLGRVRNSDTSCASREEQVLRSLVYVMVEDSRQCFAQLRVAVDEELSDITRFVREIARVIPSLVDDPKAQIVADMVMEKRYEEARQLILELEDEKNGFSKDEMAKIVERMQAAARSTQ